MGEIRTIVRGIGELFLRVATTWWGSYRPLLDMWSRQSRRGRTTCSGQLGLDQGQVGLDLGQLGLDLGHLGLDLGGLGLDLKHFQND